MMRRTGASTENFADAARDDPVLLTKRLAEGEICVMEICGAA
jgi:hypothetical protein